MKKLAFCSVLMALCTVMFAGCAGEEKKAPETPAATTPDADEAASEEPAE